MKQLAMVNDPASIAATSPRPKSSRRIRLRSKRMPSRAATIAAAKQALREDTWARLERARVALFPGARGRIPNFKGAALAADRLGATPEWQRARELKCNPDAPQRPVWFRALREGKRVYMAGSVAVNRAGARVGKGGGYSDLEYAIGREVGSIDGNTRIATTVHSLQVVDDDLPTTAHDFLLDLIVTPDEVVRPARTRRRQPRGVLREHLRPEHRELVPVLRVLGF
jgi:5-formyltetrahydrofolate cyclo-ligase